MSYELSVIAPCYNEAGNLRELTSRVLTTFSKNKIQGELILVDDASQDQTLELAQKLAQENPQIKVLSHEENKGLFVGWKTGLKNAQGDYACFIDADLQNLPEDVARLYLKAKQTGTDLVQGYRSSIGRIKDSRYIFSRGLNFMLNSLFGMRLKDNKSGFVLALRQNLEDILQYRYRYFYPQTFIGAAAHAKGYQIEQIETLFQSRLAGDSFITKNPFKPIFLSLFDLVRGFFEFRFYQEHHFFKQFLKKNRIQKKIPKLGFWRKALFNLYFLTFPLHKWMVTSRVKKYYHVLARTQWLNREQIKSLKEKRLRSLIGHAYHHVGYYREMFDRLGLKPQDIQTIDDLQKLPLLTKADVRENLYHNLLSDNHDKKKVLKITTSGSTGEPFVCYVDRYQLEMRMAATMRGMEWAGYTFGDKQMRLWHQTLGMSGLQVFKEKFDALLMRRVFIPAFELDDQKIKEFVSKIKKTQPKIIDGYAESFIFLAEYIQKHGWQDQTKIKAMISSAQVLPEKSRKIIEGIFGCRVYDKYGSREFSGIAYEAKDHEGHLVVEENFIVEVLKEGKPAKPGETGEVVITDLNNYCMPFIRYRIGDLATVLEPTDNPNQRQFLRLGKIQGRVQSIVQGANGRYLPGTFFSHLFKDYDYLIRQYKVVQKEPKAIELYLVKALSFSEKGLQELLKVLHQFLGSQTAIQVHYVDKIPMVRTGKQQGVVSFLNFDFQELDQNQLSEFDSNSNSNSNSKKSSS